MASAPAATEAAPADPPQASAPGRMGLPGRCWSAAAGWARRCLLPLWVPPMRALRMACQTAWRRELWGPCCQETARLLAAALE